LPPEQRRRHSVGVYLTDAERSQLEALAIPDGTEGLSELGIRRRLARHLRTVGLENTPPQIPAINRQAWASLGRVAGNLNQYQAAINEGRATGYPPAVLEELRDQVQALRRELIGAPEPEAEDDEG
jgi:hypothetical protein